MIVFGHAGGDPKLRKPAIVLPDADGPPEGAGDLYEVVNGRVVEQPTWAFESIVSTRPTPTTGAIFCPDTGSGWLTCSTGRAGR